MTRHLLAVAAAAALIPAGAAEASSLHGVVVHRNHRAHSFVVANANGRMAAVHATRSPRVGSRVSLKATKLANGTYRGSRIRGHGRAHRARLRGIVTFVDRANRRFTLSSRGVSLLVRLGKRPRQASDPTLPAPGDDVTVTTDLDQSDDSTVVTDPSTIQVGQTPAPAGAPIQLEGTVLAIDQTTRTLMLSADDDNASGQAISVVLPDTFDITAFHVGDEVELLATLNADGVSYTAVSSSGDDNAQQAEDQGDDQGDHAQGDNAQGDDNQGEDNQGDDNAQGDDTQSGDTPQSTPTTPPSGSDGSGDQQDGGSGHDGGGDGGGGGHGD